MYMSINDYVTMFILFKFSGFRNIFHAIARSKITLGVALCTLLLFFLLFIGGYGYVIPETYKTTAIERVRTLEPHFDDLSNEFFLLHIKGNFPCFL